MDGPFRAEAGGDGRVEPLIVSQGRDRRGSYLSVALTGTCQRWALAEASADGRAEPLEADC